jgi:NAD(P)-dependent dehydrogenase (short-subunit alcohol dehydrogenase family)
MVAGVTIGIVVATVKAPLDGGAEVLLTGQSEQNSRARRELGHRAHVIRSDTAIIADIDMLAAQVKEKLGRIDFLFISAGFFDVLFIIA